MTEAEWLTSNDSTPMLEFLRGRVSERKVRLFAVACCYEIWLLEDDRCRKAIETAERFADGLETLEELERVSFAAEDASNVAYEKGDGVLCNAGGAAILTAQGMGESLLQDFMPNIIANVVESAEEAGLKTKSAMLVEVATLLRHHIGNPFRPISLDPAWLTLTVVNLTQEIYNERDFNRLPIVGDALEEAGCTDADVLDHCRHQGKHFRGCWVMDLLLGKK